jgi:glycosyltransferase involved in cell wall biosynthesis
VNTAVVTMRARVEAPAYPIVLSNGFSRFQLSVAAEELTTRGAAPFLITGAYPRGPLRWIATAPRLGGRSKPARLLARGVAVPADRVRASAGAEALAQLASVARRRSANRLAERLVARGMRAYGRRARAWAPRAAGGIYHYRSGYGSKSVLDAKRAHAIALCDHSIAHPETLAYLVENGGALPPPDYSARLSPMWELVMRDLHAADHVLVNSDFVKTTFLARGWPAERVSVVYWGIDDDFFQAIPPREPSGGSLHFGFAGALGRRKGFVELSDAFASLGGDWTLDLFGEVETELGARATSLFSDPRVTYHGVVPRSRLAAELGRIDVFVFPSLAEGSARVVFEALAAGCFVITTPNAGSIVEDGVHGALVPPGHATALRSALVHALACGESIGDIAAANAALIRERYRQRDYGDALLRTYQRVRSAA